MQGCDPLIWELATICGSAVLPVAQIYDVTPISRNLRHTFFTITEQSRLHLKLLVLETRARECALVLAT